MDARDRDSLERIVEHAAAAIDYAGSVPDWRTDQKTIDAIVLRVGQVGEHAATTRLSVAGQAAIPDVPWPLVRQMRNHLYHRYEELDLDVLADTLAEDLPDLIAKVRVALDEEEE